MNNNIILTGSFYRVGKSQEEMNIQQSWKKIFQGTINNKRKNPAPQGFFNGC